MRYYIPLYIYCYNDIIIPNYKVKYYEENISEISHTNQTLYAYYYTNKYLGYGIKNNKATISSFDYTGYGMIRRIKK